MEFYEILSELRKQNNLSQEDLANQLRISRQAVSKWETNQSLPDSKNLIELSKIFNVSVDELLGLRKPEERINEIRWKESDLFFDYQSKLKIGKIPLVHIRHRRGMFPFMLGRTSLMQLGFIYPQLGVAKGVIAIGDCAFGVFALGFFSLGIISLGMISLGILSLAMISFGLISLGLVSIGVLTLGLTTIGVYSFGLASVGARTAVGNAASAPFAIGQKVNGLHAFVTSKQGCVGLEDQVVTTTSQILTQIKTVYPNTPSFILWLLRLFIPC